ncbi:DUF6233 domain-containing protein [Streptomyces youssoufiensis]
MISRTRTSDGAWWYECEAILPDRRVEPDGRSRPVGAPTPIVLPANRVTPIPGEDYSTLPTEGAVEHRQWRVERTRRQGPPPYARLHARGCWKAAGDPVTTGDAAGLLADGAVVACEVCRPEPDGWA